MVVWSVANETSITAERTQFLKALVDTARSLDGSQLISAAMEVHGDKQNRDLRIVDDPFGEFTDLVSFTFDTRLWLGWTEKSNGPRVPDTRTVEESHHANQDQRALSSSVLVPCSLWAPRRQRRHG